MKLPLAAAALAVSTIVYAQAAHQASGVVTKIDKEKVTIKHGPVTSLGWPGMTMAFTVKDKAVADRLVKDRKVDFEFRQEGRDYVVTAVK